MSTQQHWTARRGERTQQRAPDDLTGPCRDVGLLAHLGERYRRVVRQHGLKQRVGKQQAGLLEQSPPLGTDRTVANTLAELIIGGALASFEISRRMGGKASGEGGGEAA